MLQVINNVSERPWSCVAQIFYTTLVGNCGAVRYVLHIPDFFCKLLVGIYFLQYNAEGNV